MEIHIIDLKTDTRIKITDCEQFKNISIGHKMSVNYKNKYGTNRYMDGTICSIEHQIDKDDKGFDYTLVVKIY